MLTDENNRAPARLLDFASASGGNVLNLADPQPLAALAFQSGKRLCRLLDLPEDDNPRPKKLFPEISARHPEVVADLPVPMAPSSGVVADAILHDRIFQRRPSPASAYFPRDANSVLNAAARVLRLTAALFLAPERLEHSLPPVSSVLAVLAHPLVARTGGYCCSGRLRGSGLSP